MEDQDKWRDRVTVELDNRQIFLVFSASAVVLTLVFALGVVVGKRLNVAAPDAPKTDPLALLDQISAEQARQEAELTFAETLSTPPQKSGEAKAVSVPEPKATAADNVVFERPRRDPTKANPKAQNSVSKAKREARPPKATVDVSKKTRADVEQHEKSAPNAETGVRYTLQLSSFQDRFEAEQFAKELTESGVSPRIVKAAIDGRGVWYRVRLGSYSSWENAMAAKNNFERKHAIIAYVARD